ncbi:hypothetical protein CALCODRAFT_254482 [Calocera cornea HHB12733]|uniref:Uncharacterized protein n=1 Tax=Calocera cornea HHB12733 TaxID=1353952 RepID=A0A165GMA4_9BASI|nr:hypothetical protein CALCODRAFT_254482 [Calocera cornea HHB12733]
MERLRGDCFPFDRRISICTNPAKSLSERARRRLLPKPPRYLHGHNTNKCHQYIPGILANLIVYEKPRDMVQPSTMSGPHADASPGNLLVHMLGRQLGAGPRVRAYLSPVARDNCRCCSYSDHHVGYAWQRSVFFFLGSYRLLVNKASLIFSD